MTANVCCVCVCDMQVSMTTAWTCTRLACCSGTCAREACDCLVTMRGAATRRCSGTTSARVSDLELG
jgi:hypothetical protein